MSYGSPGAGVWAICSALPALTSAPGRPMFFTFSLMTRAAFGSASTRRVWLAPRERASRPMAPEPA